MSEEPRAAEIVHCNKCNKMIAYSLVQEFKSDSPILKGFLICIPCTLRLKDTIKYNAIQL